VLSDATDCCRLILLRHPELAETHRSLVVGGGEAPLSRRGRAVVLRWRADMKRLPPSIVFTADVPQCKEPAAAVADAVGAELVVDPRLRDQDMGAWQGKSWEAAGQTDPAGVRAFFEQFGERNAPGGETLGAAVERVLEFWNEVSPPLVGKTVAMVLAGNLISGLTVALLGMRLSRAPSLHLPHGASAILDVYENGVRIATWHPEAVGDEA
jgi:broad specificity phosphatase PhoE